MLIWFDTEFIDTGTQIDLISIGAVRADGKTYYAEALECDRSKACDWVRGNVFPHLTGALKMRSEIASDMVQFAGYDPEFWAWYAAYDWVCLSQLYGRMLDVPQSWPQFVCDLAPIWHWRNRPVLPPQPSNAHNALADAVWTREVWEICK